MRIALVIFLSVHGLIHILGGIKAFKPSVLKQLRQPVSPVNGILWLSVTVLVLASAVMLLLHHPLWWISATVAFIISQFVIIRNWNDAKYGTIPNIVLAFVIVTGYATWNYHERFKADANTHLQQIQGQSIPLLTEADVRHLPAPVKKYIRYTGSMNKPRVISFTVEFTGRIREKEGEWMNFTSNQYNFQEPSTRLFFMNATMKHLPVAGYHCYTNGTAFMDIRLLSLFTVQYQSGNEMNSAETVTFFNDMCVMAPATLVDPRIRWTAVDSLHTDATFTNHGITISASLFFNEKGELVNFVSGDRYATSADNTMQRLPWSTPLKNYREFNGTRLATEAQAIYTYPEGEFCYGEFRLTGVTYNPLAFEK